MIEFTNAGTKFSGKRLMVRKDAILVVIETAFGYTELGFAGDVCLFVWEDYRTVLERLAQ